MNKNQNEPTGKMPFKVPDGFFESLPDEIAGNLARYRKKRPARIGLRLAAGILPLAACVAVAMLTVTKGDTIPAGFDTEYAVEDFDSFLKELSDEELDMLVIEARLDPVDMDI